MKRPCRHWPTFEFLLCSLNCPSDSKKCQHSIFISQEIVWGDSHFNTHVHTVRVKQLNVLHYQWSQINIPNQYDFLEFTLKLVNILALSEQTLVSIPLNQSKRCSLIALYNFKTHFLFVVFWLIFYSLGSNWFPLLPVHYNDGRD